MSVSAPYYGDSAVMRTPPPDLPSLLLKERIVYLGLPLFSDDDAKRQMGIDVTELIIAQLLYLEFDNPEKPIFFYINSTGTSWYSGDAIGFETEAFAIADTLRYVKPPVHTICIGQAMGTAAMILSAGTKGHRAALPHASIVLHQPRSGARGQATDIQIRAERGTQKDWEVSGLPDPFAPALKPLWGEEVPTTLLAGSLLDLGRPAIELRQQP
jgi:ATP-dependent Clp protease protease subunit